MDNYRRTISSEEQIGEALMRVSNTLEAQRLTKSLEFQEKARRRTRLRFVLSIVLLVLLLVSLIVLALFVFVLFKYLDPFLEKFIPFAGSMFDDFGTIWDSLVASSTYMPVFLEQFSRLNEELITLLKTVNTLNIKGMIDNLNNLLANTNALLVTTNGLLRGLSSMMGQLNEALVPMLKSMAGMITALNSALTPMLNGFAQGATQVDWAKMVTDGASMMSDFLATGDAAAKAGMTFFQNSDPKALADGLNAGAHALSDGAGAISKISGALSSDANQKAINDMMSNLVTTTSGLSSTVANLSKAMEALTKFLANPLGGLLGG